ncbi:carotenoid oxygenase family protein [Streptomyces sp. NPDC046832]|uniref:carotenoid oxygenase family protein n=1 Tax=Streptomyces sp. NPDC046832 TaxID=3155020 RepID=UPI0033F95825
MSRRHRYGYSAAAAEMSLAYQTVDGTPPDSAFADALIKHDLPRGTPQVHRLPAGAAASEVVFVPSDPCDGRGGGRRVRDRVGARPGPRGVGPGDPRGTGLPTRDRPAHDDGRAPGA